MRTWLLTDDNGDDVKACENSVRVSRLRQACSELSIKVPRQTSHDEGASKYAFILTDDVHKASHLLPSCLDLSYTLQQLHYFNFTSSK